MTFDYFYGSQAEQFSFYRIPRLLIKDSRFKKLSSDAKIHYGLMLDRVSLSMKNGWIDDQGRAYIFFTVDDITDELCCSKPTAVKITSELDTKKGIVLIEKKRQGLGRPDIIYVKDFTSEIGGSDDNVDDGETPEVKNFNFSDSKDFTTEPETDELPEVKKFNFCDLKDFTTGLETDELPEVKNLNFYNSNIFTSGGKEIELQEVNEIDPNYTDYNYNERNHIESNQSQDYNDRDGLDKMDEIADTLELIKENIEYDHHMRYDSEDERKRYDELYQVIVDTIFDGSNVIRIGDGLFPYEVVRSRLLKLNSSHLEYVRQCIANNTGEVRNMKKYMLAALYNAPTTMDTYYTQLVNHDMRGGGWLEAGIVGGKT